jgi:hypothetical protein
MWSTGVQGFNIAISPWTAKYSVYTLHWLRQNPPSNRPKFRPVGTRSVRSVTASATARSSAWPGRRCWAPRSIRCCRCWTPTGSRGAVGEAWWVGRLGKWGGSMFPNSSGVDGGKLNQQCWGHHLCSHKLQSWISSRLRLRSVGMLSHVEPCWTTCNCWLKHHMQTLETIGIRRD